MARSHLCLNTLTCYFFMLLRFSSHLDMCTHTIWLLLPLSYTHTAHSVDSTRRSEKRISGTRDVRWQVRRRSAWRLGLMSVGIKGFSWGKGLRWRGENTDSVAFIYSRTLHSLTILWPVYTREPQRLSKSMQAILIQVSRPKYLLKKKSAIKTNVLFKMLNSMLKTNKQNKSANKYILTLPRQGSHH